VPPGEAARAGGPALTVQHLYRRFLAARILLGVVLMVAQIALLAIGATRQVHPLLLCTAYAAVAGLAWFWPAAPRAGALRRRHWIATIGCDLIAFGALHVLGFEAQNSAALFAMPVLMAGVMTSRLSAQAVAALASVELLATAWWRIVEGGDAGLLLTQAGIAGGGLFVISLVASEVAQRMARDEVTVRQTLETARQQAQLNRLVIEEMQEGVMVVDRLGRVRAANPSARHLLVARGMAPAAPFMMHGVAHWQPLMAAVERAFVEGHWPQAGRDVAIGLDAPDASVPRQRQVRLRMRFTRRRDGNQSEDLCVMFLEDIATVAARARQEKLAAMGRVSAGIAHEIRNPLAAIAQANALLAEDLMQPQQLRLAQMVSANVERLKRIVDDVLEVAPAAQPFGAVIDLGGVVASICEEWARTANVHLDAQAPLQIDLGAGTWGVRFDPDHLRRVLVNLLDNALRHCLKATGSVLLRIAPGERDHVVLSVASDGELIPPEVEHYLFEPFFSTRSRGTGLGLYICRELCERYGATIDYRQQPAGSRHGNVFLVAMPTETPGESGARAPLQG
jgi:two-component system sensor histidine kinase PilS (NtrC family)